VNAPARRNAAQDSCYYGFGHDAPDGSVRCGKWRSGVSAPGRCAYSTPVRVKIQLGLHIHSGGPMELSTVRELLTKVASDHSGASNEEGLKYIARALLHIAEAVADIQRRLPVDTGYA
jgi:hypothetical protein